jgi:M6 family metalloprotease-like protein
MSLARALYENELPTGFVTSKFNFATSTGTVKWALIPLDFPDLTGEANYKKRVEDQMLLLSEWYSIVSEGKLKIEWVIADKWVRMPKPTTEYTIGDSNNVDRAPNGVKLFTDAMTQSDAAFDFAGVQTVNFILPKGQTFLSETSQGFPWDKVVKDFVTGEGKISSYAIAGVFMDNSGRAYWSYWAHEFGHAIGIPHVGGSRGPAYAFNTLDLMGNQDGPSRELSGWLRFVIGWMPDEKVFCQDYSTLKSTEVSLVPLNSTDSGLKMTVIALSKDRSLILESRRGTKFACTTSTVRNGVLAYIYDAKLGHNEDFLIPVTIPGRQMEGSSCTAPQSVDNLLRAGDKITFEGVTIEVLTHDDFDRVRISKAG